VESKVDKSELTSFIDDSLENDMSLDSPQYQQVTHHWVVMRQSNAWRPPTDVFELEDRLVVMVEIAGMRDGEFNVVLQDRRLLITGVRRRVVRDRIAFHQMEVRYGEFRTGISLPWPVDREKVAATYKDGFLRVELPRALNQQVHIVNVDVEQEERNKQESDEE
jgi:HSP20 family protein